ncbi:hypothetical protein DYBT9275_03068 [Dyadobacter sp. CECT 9275]|uniref:Uncharacterized protein n=1 Tax=Dyadobacter helix TaxID=2822344 RepID=A0A916NLW8_9BACT|nr:hypothetical protein DYBT9275_03068 [Dyadobacter sp. CECT 9275]
MLRDCDILNENYDRLGLSKIGSSLFVNEQSREFREMTLAKMQTMDLMTGYNIELRIQVNRRWEEPENQLPQTFAEALMLATKQARLSTDVLYEVP